MSERSWKVPTHHTVDNVLPPRLQNFPSTDPPVHKFKCVIVLCCCDRPHRARVRESERWSGREEGNKVWPAHRMLMTRPTHEDDTRDLGRSPQAQARRDREREASNDRRSQDVFRGLYYLKAQVELEFARKTSKELAGREPAAQEIAEEDAQTKRKRGTSEPSPAAPAVAAEEDNEEPPHGHSKAEVRPSNGDQPCGEPPAGQEDAQRGPRAAEVKKNGKGRRSGGGVIDLSDELAEPPEGLLPMDLGGSIATPLPPPTVAHGGVGKPALRQNPHPSDAAATAAVGVQRGEWGQTTQQAQGERQQQAQEFPPAVLALQLQEWGETQQQQPLQEAAAAASTLRRQEWGRDGSAATHSLGGGSFRDDQEAGHDQPPFVMLGMLSDSRALLLPTTGERREAMGSLASASVPVTWTDSAGQSRTAILTRTKTKPLVCNPLPMLANLLAWMRELPPGALPENRPCVRLETLLARQSSSKSASRQSSTIDNNSTIRDNGDITTTIINNNNNYYNTSSNYDDRSPGGGAGHGDLSLGAAWLLAHLMFGSDGGGDKPEEYVERARPNGKVSLSGAEANVMPLLLCPLIGWSPRPSEVIQAMSEAGGSLCAYSVEVAAFETQPGICDKAADELVHAGFARKVAFGETLVLDQKMENTCELVLKIFLGYNWDPHRTVFARVALGLTKTGPMANGVCPPDIPYLLADRQTRRSSTTAVRGGDEGLSCRGRMGGLVGDLCVRLYSWFYMYEENQGPVMPGDTNLRTPLELLKARLLPVLKGETEGDQTSRREWTGPMAQAFGLLGGAEVAYHKRSSDSVGGTASAGWVASLSKEERLLEVACLRLKQAMRMVLLVVEGVVGELQKAGGHDEAVLTLRLLVRRDQGLAGPMYSETAPDLVWAADWVTCQTRGFAYTRLAINLKTHLKRPGEEQLDVVKTACDDDCVRGGDRVDLWERYQGLHKKFGNQQTAMLRGQQQSPFWDPKVEDLHPPVETQKQGSKGARGEKGGRKIYYYDDAAPGERRWSEARSHFVEEVLMRERYCTGGWLGLHCESTLIMFILMLLLWEEVFDCGVEAAVPHCIAISPVDFRDKFFTTRRKGLPGRLATIRRYTDRQLFSDVDQRYDRLRDVLSVWCEWHTFPKQQIMEICVAFGGKRLSDVLNTLTNNLRTMDKGFPDVVLWRPKGADRGAGGSSSGGGRDGRDWNARTHFGLGWQGHGHGWEVEVVEVKSKGDTISKEQKAWLAELEDIGVPAIVTRVLAENEDVPKKRSRSR